MRLSFCGRCGAQAVPGDNTCRRCGAPLVIGEDATTRPTPPPPGPQPYVPPFVTPDTEAERGGSPLRWLLAAGLLAALGAVVVTVVLLLALGSGGSSPALVGGESPTVSPAASPAASPTAPAAAPSPARSSPTAVPTPVSMQALLASKGFTPAGDPVATDDGQGGRLAAVKGICQGSADGYCQQVFFFDNGQYLGTDTLGTSFGIISVAAAGAARISVTYAHYAPEDPLCCPSLLPVTITYTWTGSGLQPSGTPPGH